MPDQPTAPEQPDDGLIPVRTTMRPWEELRVDPREYEHLLAEGLVAGQTEQEQIARQVADTEPVNTPPADPAPNTASPTTSSRKRTQ